MGCDPILMLRSCGWFWILGLLRVLCLCFGVGRPLCVVMGWNLDVDWPDYLKLPRKTVLIGLGLSGCLTVLRLQVLRTPVC